METENEEWDIVEVVAQRMDIRKSVVENIVRMVEVEDCTIPFIARYRKEQTRGMPPETLRQFTEMLHELRDVQKKATTMIKNVEKQGKLNNDVEKSLKCAQTMDELNHVFAPFKGDKKHSLADRARSLGLDEAAIHIIDNPKKTNLRKWVTKGVEGRSTLSDVEKGVKHLLANHIAKHQSTIENVRKIFNSSGMSLESKLSQSKKKTDDTNASTKSGKSSEMSHKNFPDEKYRIYYDFKCRVNTLQSYQVLAINRGETQKQLTVKIVMDERMENSFLSWLKYRWVDRVKDAEIKNLVQTSIDDAYTRLIKPLVLRRTRSDLTKTAQLTSVQVFCRNLNKLLLTAPVRGKIVLGVDPGYRNGCKCAIISATGSDILATDVFNLNRTREAIAKVTNLYERHRFEVIGIGNGTACRETEQFISSFISRVRNPNLVYCIVNENGASIYSVTDEAEKEMPNLDPNLRSAVSIARRLQDPLVELVKIEPKHLGVGMYQHDIPATLMKAALRSVVEDCVTFVGVDLNVAGPSLLGYVAGIKPGQVKKILEWRKKNGKFVNRQQLLEVGGLGAKTFQQCAGFMRISHVNGQKFIHDLECVKNEVVEMDENLPTGKKRKLKSTEKTRSKKKKMTNHQLNPLDQTWIHPESYEITEKFLQLVKCDASHIGKSAFISQIKQALSQQSLHSFAQQLSVGEPTLQLIIDGLSQPSGYRDIREESSKPLYRRGLKSPDDLRSGDTVRGRVTNMTDFGVFVDVGVGQDGLVHRSEMCGRWEELRHTLGPNDVITVMVKHIDRVNNKVALRLTSANVVKPILK